MTQVKKLVKFLRLVKLPKWINKRNYPILGALFIALTIVGTVSVFGIPQKKATPDSFIGFNEGYGTTLHDSQQLTSGTINNAVWKAKDECFSDKCLYFDGVGDYVTFGDDSNFDFAAATNFTIELWFKTPKRSGYESTDRMLVSKELSSTGTDGGYILYMDTLGKLVFAIDDDANVSYDDAVISTLSYDDSQWHHVAAVKTGTTSIALYIDGNKIGEDTSLVATGTLVNTDPLTLGIASDLTSSAFTGYIDEFKIYTTTAQSLDQIKKDMQKDSDITTGNSATFSPTSEASSKGLVGYWRFENTGTDYSGNNNGLSNVLTTNVAGYRGQGAEFNGSSQFEYVSKDSLDNARTFSFWANPDANTNYLFTYNGATVSASSGAITTSGLLNPKIYINGALSSTLTANTWQYVTVTTDSLLNSSTITHHLDAPYKNSGAGYASAIYCITSNDCKMIYYNTDDYSLRFRDCDDATCSSGTESIIDGATGCSLTGGDGCDPSTYLISGNNFHNRNSLYCPTADDCKISYYDAGNSALKFADCDNATCSSGSVEILDGMTGCGLSGGGGCSTSSSVGSVSSLICPTADDCKISYYDTTNTALRFADCANATCSSGSTYIIDGATGCTLTSGDGCSTANSVGQWLSLQCPTAGDCKTAYYDTTNTALLFADCADATCSSGSVEILDGNTACGLSSGDACDTARSIGTEQISMDCPAADNCKVAYSTSDLYMADCANATCSSGSVELVDGATGCGLTGCSTFNNGVSASIDCPTEDNCKISYATLYNAAFADCGNSSCSSGTVSNIDGEASCTLTGGEGCNTDAADTGRDSTYIYCVSASDCKVSYQGYENSSVKFADCDNESCNQGSVNTVEGNDNDIGYSYDIYCPSSDNCKMAYVGLADSSLRFMDCDDATCASGTETILDGAPGCALTGGLGCASTTAVSDYGVSIYCPTADNCKISYHNGDTGSLHMADCDNELCTAGTIEMLDGYTGCTLTGGDGCNAGLAAGYYSSIYCPSSNDCKIAYHDNTNSQVLFADCDDEICSSGSVEIIEGNTGCSLTGGDGCSTTTDAEPIYQHALYCGTTDNCKILIRDLTDSAIKFADCDTATCSSGSMEILDGMAGCSLSGGDGCDTTIDATEWTMGSLYCPSSDNCKVAYRDATNTALKFADCANETCSSGSVEILDGMTGCGLTNCNTSNSSGGYATVSCPAENDCRIMSYLGGDVVYSRCGDSTCSTGTMYTIDGAASCTLTGGDACSNTTAEYANYNNRIFCTDTNDCKLLYRTATNMGDKPMYFGRCADANCTTGSKELVFSGQKSTLQIGKVGTNYYDGTIDDFRVYNRTLSPNEISALYTYAPEPVVYWKLDENSGYTAYDSSGHGHDATFYNYTNGPKWVPGKVGGAYLFDSIAGRDMWSSGDIDEIDNAHTFTISTWLKVDSFTPWGIIMAEWTDTEEYTEIQFGPSEGQVYLTVGNNPPETAGYGMTPAGAFNLGEWFYLTTVFNGNAANNNDRIEIYINGVKQTLSYGGAGIPTTTDENTTPMIFSSTQGFSMDDVKIYDYVRSSSQITEDMNTGHPAPGSPVGSAIGQWSFEEGSGTTAHNTGNGGSSLNMTILGADPEWTPNGKFGKGLNMGITYEYADAGTASFLDGSTALSISFWTKPSLLTSYRRMIGKGDTLNYNNFTFSINRAQTSAADTLICISANTNDECDNYVVFDTNLVVNEWAHLVMVYDGTQASGQRVKLYKDGRSIPIINSAGTIPALFDTGSTAPLRIGDPGNNTGALGTYDELRIYTSALNENQVKLLYNGGTTAALGSLSSSAGLASGSTAAFSATATYCIPGDTSTCRAPIADWKFDENQGEVFKDNVTGVYDATMQGTDTDIWNPEGKRNTSAKFNGINNAATFTQVNLGNRHTCEFWIKWQDADDAVIIGDQTVGRYCAYIDATNIYYSAEIGEYVSVAHGTLDRNTWYHFAINRTGNTSVDFYMNGKKLGTTQTIPVDRVLLVQALGNFSDGGFPLQGELDDTRLYNYSRTAAQISWDYNQGNPIAQYDFDECSGTTLHNVTPHIAKNTILNNGTIIPGAGSNTSVGTCNSGVTTQMWNDGTTGKYSASLGFDGSDDYINLGSDSSIDQIFDDGGTISAWVNPTSFGEGGFGRIIDKNSLSLMVGETSVCYHCFVFINEGDTLGRWVTPNDSAKLNEWHNVVVTYNSSSTSNDPLIYIDGKQVVVTELSTPVNPWDDSAEDMYIGANNNGYLDRAYEGLIDDVRIFQYILTPTQVLTVFNKASAVSFE